MLRRQQAEAVIAARQKIVHGAVSMVQMALSELSEKQVVSLDDDHKARMVSNLLVVLCSEVVAAGRQHRRFGRLIFLNSHRLAKLLVVFRIVSVILIS